jgi:hypothetical protein
LLARTSQMVDLSADVSTVQAMAGVVAGAAASADATFGTTVNSYLQSGLLPAQAQINSLKMTASTSYASLDNMATSFRTADYTNIRSDLRNEEASLSAWASSYSDSLALSRLQMQMAIASDAADRANILVADQTTLSAQKLAITQSIQDLLVAEASRAATDSLTASSDLVAFKSSAAAAVNAAVSAEVAKGNSQIARLAALSPARLPATTGNEDNAWCVVILYNPFCHR